ncbi:kinase-like protein [Sistotremastrum niveocremeum HHB9708]|uniref:Kinase-like protein n=2 Tax=Sistotremastraceae TaxID=3402574 RepID=A0A164P307_9AGAM|nr:kinase-like protein [Sistotremastrum niveocremeum HHB9708]KZT32492.1 kinase-like protein [Sistotremastrum suecicum HHB10207 ss-3]
MSNPLPAHVQQDFLDPRHESWFDVQDLTNLITYRDERDQPVLMGGSADIYQAELRGQPVAVKVMRITVTNENEKKELERKIRREVRIWSNIHHKNILPFLGICFFRGRDGSSNGEFPWFSLVSPWMKNGTAGRYIREVKGACVITVLHEFLSGLSFLHQNSVIHGDLKPSNIFISDDGTAMLADFGLSRSTWGGSFVATPGLTTTSTGIKGSLRWTAPELLEKPKATQASDMWAVGCILLELVGLMPPYGDYRTESNIIYAISSHKLPHEAPDLSAANDRLSYHNTMRSYSVHLGPGVFDRYPGLWDLCLRCWSIDPAARPPCYNVYQFLMMIEFVYHLLATLVYN